VLLLVPLLLPATASARHQDREMARPASETPRVTEIEFHEAENVDGARLVPEGEVVTGATGPVRPSLITVRPSFRTELLRSADDL
jgi:hypothetical protein